VRADYKLTGAADADSADLYTIRASSLSVPSAGYYDLGELEITDSTGDYNNGQRRMIRKIESGVIYLVNPLPYLAKSGDTFDIYPGCDLLIETCKTRFAASNEANFYGFLYIPQPEDVGAGVFTDG
jgi:uncharacterized phage protein (TIGR02218 family)